MAVLVDGKRFDFYSLDGERRNSLEIEGGARFFDWHPDGDHIMYGTADQKYVKVLHLASQTIVAQTEGGDTKRVSAALEPTKGDVIAILSTTDCAFWRWKVERVPQKRIKRTSESVMWTPDGEGVLFLGEFSVPTLCDAEGNVLATYDQANQSAACTWRKDGSHVLFSESRFQPKRTLFTREGELKATVDRNGLLGISPDAAEFSDKWTLDGKPHQPYEANAAATGFETPQGEYLISASGNMLRIWKTRTRDLHAIVLILEDGESVVFSSAGEVLRATSRAAVNQLVYVVEEPDGRQTTLSQQAFYKRVGLEPGSKER